MKWFPRISAVLAVASVCCLSAGSPAMAVPPTRTPSTPIAFGALPAGVACTFAVSIDLVSGDQGHTWTFFDHNSNVVRQQTTARASTWKITNLDTGKSATISLPGANTRVATASDGTTTVVIDGGAIGFNAPTDSPPGPFALANVGHLVVVIDPSGHGTLSLTGKQTDLCALVAP